MIKHNLPKKPELPHYLRSAIELVDRAYPNGVHENDFLPLLHVMSEYLSHRHLALCAEVWDNSCYRSHYNDVLKAISEAPDTSIVSKRLEAAGLDAWMNEDSQADS